MGKRLRILTSAAVLAMLLPATAGARMPDRGWEGIYGKNHYNGLYKNPHPRGWFYFACESCETQPGLLRPPICTGAGAKRHKSAVHSKGFYIQGNDWWRMPNEKRAASSFWNF